MLKNYFLFFICLFCVLDSFCQHSITGDKYNQVIDSLNVLIKKDGHDSLIAMHKRLIAKELSKTDIDSALIVMQQAIVISEKLKIKRILAVCINNLGNIYVRNAEYFEAISCYRKALKIDSAMGNLKGLAINYGAIGAVYSFIGDYPKSIENCLIASQIGTKINDKALVCQNIGNLGGTYAKIHDYYKALEFMHQALKIENELNNSKENYSTLNNIGSVYNYLHQTDKALEYHLKALKIDEENGNKEGIATCLGNIGIDYKNLGREDLTEKYYKRALKLNEELNDERGVSIVLGNLAHLYGEQKKYLLAHKTNLRALTLSEKIGAKDDMRKQLDVMGALYEESNINLPDSSGKRKLNKEQMRIYALAYYRQGVALKDTIFSEDAKRKNLQIEMKFEFEKKEALLREEQIRLNMLADEKSKRQKIGLWSIGLGLLLVVIFAFFIFRSLKITRNQKIIIEEKQKDIIDSIHYAKRIQTSLLPSEKYIAKILNRINQG